MGRRARARRLAFGVGLAALALACGGGRPGSGQGKLLISAAASVREVVSEAAKTFEMDHPNVRIQLNFGGSGSLRQQIEKGAPVDLFLSASSDHVERLVEDGKGVAETRTVFARNRLVLIGNAGKVRSLGDLTSDAVQRLSIGDPRSVPAGRYAREWLEAEGLWAKLQQKTVLGGDVRQVLDYVRRGEVDAGVVYSTDAKLAGLEPIVAAEGAKAPEVVYEAVVIAGAQRRGPAERFLQYLGSEPVLESFRNAGFVTP